MSWTKIEHHYSEHPKVVQVSALAQRLDLECLLYCGRNLTDGLIPARAVKKLIDLDGYSYEGKPVTVSDLTDELVRVGLWKKIEENFERCDYLQYQPSRSEVEKLQKKRKAAGRKGGKSGSIKPKNKVKQNGSKTEANAKQVASSLVGECLSKSEPDIDVDKDIDINPHSPPLSEVLGELSRVAEHHSLKQPAPAAIQKCLDDFPGVDSVDVARGFACWQVDDGGRPVKNLVSSFRNQLKMAKGRGRVDVPAPPTRVADAVAAIDRHLGRVS